MCLVITDNRFKVVFVCVISAWALFVVRSTVQGIARASKVERQREVHAFFVSIFIVSSDTQLGDTLSNESAKSEGQTPSCIGIKPSALPRKSTEGVSVGSAVTEQRHWYVLRVSYGRIDKVLELVKRESIENYIPLHYCNKIVCGKKKIVSEPLLPNLIFAYGTLSGIKELIDGSRIRRTESHYYLSFYFDHFKHNNDGKNPPLIIPNDQMENFRHLTSIENEHIRLVNREDCRFKSGDFVNITDGQFKGTKGRVARVKGQQCVVVELQNICMVATAYIPSAFLQIINK